MSHNQSTPEKPTRRDHLLLAAGGTLALAPLVLLHGEFQKLFWFGGISETPSMPAVRAWK